jgi:FHA domain
MKGERFPLPPDRPTKIGRASRGVNLTMDEHASLDHAEITIKNDRFFITDLGSHSGTVVNGSRVGSEPVPLGVGSVIEVGQTVLRVVEARPTTQVYGLALAIAGPIALTIVVLGFLASRPILYDPALVATQPVRQRVRTSDVIPIPLDFVRTYGVDQRDTTLLRVTDFDGNGVDELWLGIPHHEVVVTFGDRGDWQVLGELPRDCVERTALDFPDELCNGLVYSFKEGKYQPAGIDGVVTWMRPWVVLNPDEVARDKPPRYGPGDLQPYHLSLVYPERLKGFLEARGIHEPIHYLICEEAISGVRAQVLTVSGKIQTLDYGCLGGLRLTGTSPGDNLGSEKPQAFAFTVTGYQALVHDVTTFLSGSPEGLFLDAYGRNLVKHFSAVPATRPGLRISFLGDVADGPVAPPEEDLQGLRWLARSGVASSPPPRETAANVLTPGRAVLDPPGCSKLEVQTHAWHCTLLKWCLPGRTFLTVRQTGCGRDEVIAEVPYRGGYVRGGDPSIQVAVAVDAVGSRGQIDVLRSRVAYRVPPQDAESPPTGSGLGP